MRLTKDQKRIKDNEERKDARRPAKTDIEQLRLELDFKLSPMYPHDTEPEITEEQRETDRKLRAVFKLRVSRGYMETVYELQDMFSCSIATAKRLIQQSVDYLGDPGPTDKDLDKRLMVQRLERIRNNISDSDTIEDADRYKLMLHAERLIAQIQGYDQPDRLDPKKLQEALQLPTVIRSTDPAILEKMDVEEAQIDDESTD